ncbi:small ribosomal subunit Rsm22 family protein [Halococcus hamelinensis]|uniref:TyrA operon protein n=1 Tax=Halococcus hamelinensis 100A6 TaxID=1132509 RepID=M0M033_9EURY|nr:class I SAM-dependent methyltransferase [Halococcus hamelinensis]EMA37974.1 tyrA operon protein [Halococcus hamelinensis 100A6]
MSADQREQIRANAKYLREVRPIDPEEIFEYVDGRPHPAVVRETLRDVAPDLGLVERADGTFVPVADDPIAVEFDGVSAFPDSHTRELENLLVEAYGSGWPDGESGDRLRDLIRRFKESYFAGRAVEYDTDTALAYAIYHLPDYYAVAQYVLADLARDGLLSHHLRVLDVGAGVGGPALGLADLLPGDALCEYHAIEPSPAADVLDSLLESTGRNVHPTIHRTTAEDFELDGEYDLVLFANSLSELDDPAGTARRYLDALAPDGSLVGVAPADRETSIGLRRVERALADQGPATCYGPTVRLWPGHAPTDRGWSFAVEPDFSVPGFQRRLADGAGPEADPDAFVNVDVQFSHTVLRTDGKRRVEFTPDPNRAAKMAESERHVSNRVDCVAAKLSRSLSTGNPLYKVSDGSESVDHYAVVTRETGLNRALTTADYGDLLAFENALVLWNDDEEAYNLVVDDETVVDRL